MKCMVCEIAFSAEDADMIERDNDIPICDDCAMADLDIHVAYDGSEDLLDYLKKHVHNSKRLCMSCISGTVELTRITYANPIEGYVRCGNCKLEVDVDIYLIMI